MNTTQATAAPERSAPAKTVAKPQGPGTAGPPGAFAALLLLQADDAAAPPPSDALTDPLGGTNKVDKDSSEPAGDETSSSLPPGAAEPWAALALWAPLGLNAARDRPEKGQPTDAVDKGSTSVPAAVPPGLTTDKTTTRPTAAQADNANGGFGWAAAPTPSALDAAQAARIADAAPNQPAPTAPPAPAVKPGIEALAPTQTTEALAPLSRGKPGGTGKTATRFAAAGGATPTQTATPVASAMATANGPTAPPPRSTVSLATRDTRDSTAAALTGGEQGADAPGAIRRSEPSAPLGPSVDPLAGTGTAAEPRISDAVPATEAFAEMLQGHMEELNTQIGQWAAQGPQRAHFTIGNDQGQPVEVGLALVAGELQVTLDTEEATVREALAQNAPEALQKLLDISGITLSSVTVGGGRSQTAQDGATERSTREWARRTRTPSATTSEPIPALARRAPQVMTATKLDFYA